MPITSTQELLKRINYIETDIEIQKQILHAIPSDQKGEIERTIMTIAEKKKEIDELRSQIQETDPEEFNRIIAFEQATHKFRELAKDQKFTSIVTKEPEKDCLLHLKDQKPVPCLIKAKSKNGDCTIITLEGELLQFSVQDLREQE